jgi:dTDP-4-amino-4,6-dideoxygalactose transaminase
MPDKLPFLPFALPDIGEEEIAEVVDTLRSGWVTTGPKTKRFEEDFTAFLGDPGLHSLAVNSATAGLHLALEALGIGPGDEVITTTHTFTATAEVVRYLGADVVLVDIDPATLCIDVDAVEAAITPRTKAVMPVHYGGLAADMQRLLPLARQHGLKVVEDAAHALPTTCGGQLVGTLGSDVTVFSFYANKTITTGEGGMVVTRDEALAKRMKVMRLHGIRPFHRQGAELVLRDRGAGVQVQPDGHCGGARAAAAEAGTRIPGSPRSHRRAIPAGIRRASTAAAGRCTRR